MHSECLFPKYCNNRCWAIWGGLVFNHIIKRIFNCQSNQLDCCEWFWGEVITFWMENKHIYGYVIWDSKTPSETTSQTDQNYAYCTLLGSVKWGVWRISRKRNKQNWPSPIAGTSLGGCFLEVWAPAGSPKQCQSRVHKPVPLILNSPLKQWCRGSWPFRRCLI